MTVATKEHVSLKERLQDFFFATAVIGTVLSSSSMEIEIDDYALMDYYADNPATDRDDEPLAEAVG